MLLRDTLAGASPKAEATIKMARKLALMGAGLTRSEFHLPSKPYCDEPVLVKRRTHPRDPVRTVEVSMFAPCRKCRKCLFYRSCQWHERAVVETTAAPRTWFVTLTFNPIMLAGILARAHTTSHGSFARRVDQAAYGLVQRHLKRMRKAGGAFTFLAVFERGERKGRPHYHMLIHEKVSAPPVRYDHIVSSWPSFVHAKLVDTSAKGDLVRYLCKYLTKSLDVRPRASLNYGKRKNDAPPTKLSTV